MKRRTCFGRVISTPSPPSLRSPLTQRNQMTQGSLTQKEPPASGARGSASDALPPGHDAQDSLPQRFRNRHSLLRRSWHGLC